MPFDASGNFTRNYNFVQDAANGIKILAARVDGEFDNFATGMNLVFFRDGRVPMQADLRMNTNGITGLKDGTLGSPAIKFQSDANTGPYSPGLNQYGIQVNSVQRGVFTTAGAAITGTLSATGNISEGGVNLSAKYAPIATPNFTGITTLSNGQADTYALAAAEQLRFEYNTGGFSHAIISRHKGGGTLAGNALDFWLNGGNTTGDPTVKMATLDASAGLTVNGAATANTLNSAAVASGGVFVGARNGGTPAMIIYSTAPGNIRLNNGGGADIATWDGTTYDLKTHTTMWLNANKLLVQHDGSNASIRTAAASGGLFLGAGGASTLVLASGGNVTLPINGQRLNFTDASGTSPYMSAQVDNNFAFYTTNAAGANVLAWHVNMRNASPAFAMDLPTSLPTGSTGVTQAAGDATTNLATTAFVDRLRGLQTRSVAGTTLVIGDRGNAVFSTAAVTVPNAVFAAGDVVVVYNNSAAGITLTQGASLTLRQSGTANTGNRTIAQRGFATITFISASEAVASGDIT